MLMSMSAARLLSLDPDLSPAARFTGMLLQCAGDDSRIAECNATQLVCSQASGPSPPISSMNHLPDELVLNICNYLSPSELWFNARPVSRQFHSCAKETLMQKCFHDEPVRFSWCCFWCSLGHSSLDAAVKAMTSLFSDKRKLRIECISDQALLLKLAFGGLCSTVARGEQKIHLCIGEGGEEVTITAAEWSGYMERLPRDAQQRRYGFVALYFSRVERKMRAWRIITSLMSVTHVIGFVVVGVFITFIAGILLIVGCIAWQTFRMAKAVWTLLDRLVEVCIPGRLIRD